MDTHLNSPHTHPVPQTHPFVRNCTAQQKLAHTHNTGVCTTNTDPRSPLSHACVHECTEHTLPSCAHGHLHADPHGPQPVTLLKMSLPFCSAEGTIAPGSQHGRCVLEASSPSRCTKPSSHVHPAPPHGLCPPSPPPPPPAYQPFSTVTPPVILFCIFILKGNIHRERHTT